MVSSTVWPGKSAAFGLKDLYKISPQQAQQNYLQVDIYFMSLNVKSIKETARYNVVTFIATLGGSLGVWVGFSVCMLFELLELLIDLGLSCICQRKKGGKK